MNGVITRLILAFAGGSMAFTLLPLLESGNGAPFIAVLDRSQSLVVYAGFLVVFSLFVLPEFLARDVDRSRAWPWVAVVGYILVFAAIPLVFTAYISGVSVRGLVPVVAICGALLGVPLALRRRFGGRVGARICAVLGGVFLFALPGAAVYLQSVGRVAPGWIEAVSAPHWLYRLATLRWVPDSPWPFLALMAVPWLLSLGSFRRSASRGAAAAVVAVVVVLGAASADDATVSPVERTAAAPASVTVRSLSGGVGRPGLRTLLSVTLPEGEGSAVVSAGVDAARVPRDGSAHRVLLIPSEAARRLLVEYEDGTSTEVPLPVELTDAPTLTLVIGGASEVEGVQMAASDVPAEAGALEAFDVVVVTKGGWSRLSPPARDALLRWAALGGSLARDHPSDDHDRRVGSGRDVSVERAAALMGAGVRDRASALDPELTRTFAPPDWQEMDLSALLLFAVIYHAAFLAAFLVPLLLDSRKAPTVYLTSVGFVVLVVAGFAWNVLGDIFLRDNQVYTHAITLMVADDGPSPRVASRQFLCFASMSAEDRSIRFGPATDLVVYQSPFTPRLVVRDEGADKVVLEDVHLDRFRHKLVVRVDQDGPLPLAVDGDPRASEGIRLRHLDGVPDPLGLKAARATAAWYVEDGVIIRRLQPEDDRLLPAEPETPSGLPGEVQIHVRKLLGHFAPQRRNWLLVRLSDVPRADEAREWLWSRDLGGWLLLPL